MSRPIETMPEAAIGLRLEIGLEPDADAAELEYATTQLRHELLELEVDRVDLPAAIELSNASQQDRRRLLESFLTRHAHGSP
jgi:hypothetical protein